MGVEVDEGFRVASQGTLLTIRACRAKSGKGEPSRLWAMAAGQWQLEGWRGASRVRPACGVQQPHCLNSARPSSTLMTWQGLNTTASDTPLSAPAAYAPPAVRKFVLAPFQRSRTQAFPVVAVQRVRQGGSQPHHNGTPPASRATTRPTFWGGAGAPLLALHPASLAAGAAAGAAGGEPAFTMATIVNAAFIAPAHQRSLDYGTGPSTSSLWHPLAPGQDLRVPRTGRELVRGVLRPERALRKLKRGQRSGRPWDEACGQRKGKKRKDYASRDRHCL